MFDNLSSRIGPIMTDPAQYTAQDSDRPWVSSPATSSTLASVIVFCMDP